MAKAGRFAARNATASEEAPTTSISISVVAPAFISTRNESPADAELADELSCSFQCDSWAQEEETAAMDADMASAQTRFMVTPGRTGAAPAGGVITDPECGKRGTRAPCRLPNDALLHLDGDPDGARTIGREPADRFADQVELQHVAPGGGTRDLELQFQRLTRPDDALGRKGLPEIVEIQHPAGRVAEMDAQVDGPDPGGAGSPRSRADVRHPRRYRKWFPWSNPSLRHVHLQLGFHTGALAAVREFGSGLGEEEQPAVAEVLPRRMQIALPAARPLQERIELVERQVEREAAE